jgi:hypothetical protein
MIGIKAVKLGCAVSSTVKAPPPATRADSAGEVSAGAAVEFQGFVAD